MSRTITPGTYVLTRDVGNPRPDRRVRRDWTKREVWEEGTVLIAMDYTRVGGTPSLSLVGDRLDILHRVDPWHDGYLPLVSALEPCEESLAAMFTRLDVDSGAQYLIRFLVETDRMTKEQFERTWSEYQEWMNREPDAQPDNAKVAP